MLGPGGSDGNQVTEAFFHLISDEATGNRMTSLKLIIRAWTWAVPKLLRNWMRFSVKTANCLLR